MRLALLLVACVGLLAACGDGPDPDPTPTPGPTETPAPATGLPVIGTAAQNLEFFGDVTGVMTFAQVTCVHFRGATPDKDRLQVALDGSVGNQQHRLRIIVEGYGGPGEYDWDGVAGSGPQVSVTLDNDATGHAIVSVDGEGGSGVIEAALTRPTVGRISGIWACPSPPQ